MSEEKDYVVLSPGEINSAFRGYNIHASLAVKESIAYSIIVSATPLIEEKIKRKLKKSLGL